MNLPPLPELPKPKLFDWANEFGHITYSIFPPMHVPPRLGKYFTDDQVRELLQSYGRAVVEACARAAEAQNLGRSTPTYWNEACAEIAAAIRNGVIREGEGE